MEESILFSDIINNLCDIQKDSIRIYDDNPLFNLNNPKEVKSININACDNILYTNSDVLDKILPFYKIYSLNPDIEFIEIDDSISVENRINENRLLNFKKYKNKIIQLINENDFEYGYSSKLDEFILELIKINRLATKELLNDLLIEEYNDASIVCGLLRTVSHIDYDEITPQGDTMALAALSHIDLEVKECGIRAFENWANSESLSVLESTNIDNPFLQNYLDKVILDIKEELSQDVFASSNDRKNKVASE